MLTVILVKRWPALDLKGHWAGQFEPPGKCNTSMAHYPPALGKRIFYQLHMPRVSPRPNIALSCHIMVGTCVEHTISGISFGYTPTTLERKITLRMRSCSLSKFPTLVLHSDNCIVARYNRCVVLFFSQPTGECCTTMWDLLMVQNFPLRCLAQADKSEMNVVSYFCIGIT